MYKFVVMAKIKYYYKLQDSKFILLWSMRYIFFSVISICQQREMLSFHTSVQVHQNWLAQGVDIPASYGFVQQAISKLGLCYH